MYASHRDACIFSRYAALLGDALDGYYRTRQLTDCVIAYRQLGQANYNFAADVQSFALKTTPCMVLCLDVSDFFGSLDHRLLKMRLKRILGVSELPDDWYLVFKRLTRYSWINIVDLKANVKFSERIKAHSRAPIATIEEILAAGIPIRRNLNPAGIPQGTPISSALSNLYMMDFDQDSYNFCESIGGLYRRYSDDILVICPVDMSVEAEQFLSERIAREQLKINADKTSRTLFDPSKPNCAQYLGFNLSPSGATIRESSLSRQWRKLRRSLKKIRAIGEAAILNGDADKVYTRGLRRRFSPLPVRNFLSVRTTIIASDGVEEDFAASSPARAPP